MPQSVVQALDNTNFQAPQASSFVQRLRFRNLLGPCSATAPAPQQDTLQVSTLLFSLATTSLLSVGFFDVQTLQFAAQGDDLVGFALIIFL